MYLMYLNITEHKLFMEMKSYGTIYIAIYFLKRSGKLRFTERYLRASC